MKAVEDDGARRPQERGERVGGVQAALLGRSQQGREDLLGLRSARGAIAAAAHFPGDHRRAQGMLSAPIGGIERRVEEEAEDGLEFGPQMGGEAAGVGESAGSRREQAVEAVDVVAARDGEALVRHVPESMAVPRGESRLQQRLHLRRKRMVRMVQDHRATAAQQMGETRLVRGLRELPVRRPAVALQHAGIVRAEDGGRLGKAPPVLNRIDGRVAGGEGPEPVIVAADLPARFIGGDDGAATDRGAEDRVGRLRLARGPVDRVDEPPARDGEPEAIAEQVGDLPEGEAELFIQNDRERDGLRAELHGGGAERIRRLQRVAPLDATVALRTATDRDPKLMDDGALHGQVFLVLREDALATHRPAAIGTVRRQRRLMCLVDACRRRTMRVSTVRRSRFATRTLGVRLRQTTRKRGGLPSGMAARSLELFFQAFILAPQAVPLDLRAPQVFLEPFNPARLIVDDLARVVGRRILRAPRHAMLMPDSRVEYKREMRTSRALTR